MKKKINDYTSDVYLHLAIENVDTVGCFLLLSDHG